MRGPSTSPAWMACFKAMTTCGSAPTSRMVVKPASSVALAEATETKALSKSVTVTASAMGLPPSNQLVMWS